MVVPYGPKNDITLIEAANPRVRLIGWSSLKKEIGKMYIKIVYRHLDWERTEDSLDALRQFVGEVQGNAY